MERFTISLDRKLAGEFDRWIAARSYANRSEAVRDLLRAELDKARPEHEPDAQCVACLSYVYDHHQRELAERLTALQHAHHELTIASMHAHLDHDHCLETVILRGASAAVQQFADTVCAERGVHHGKLNLIGVELHEPHRPQGHKAAGKQRANALPHVHLKPSH